MKDHMHIFITESTKEQDERTNRSWDRMLVAFCVFDACVIFGAIIAGAIMQ